MPVAGFFAKLRRTVEGLAPPGTRGQPRVVLLSAGARDESSFEHAYLARYLGYELVEGRDLSVRGGFVYLKTLSGLRKPQQFGTAQRCGRAGRGRRGGCG